MTAAASRTVVLDSSALVALLVDGGATGDWVAATIDARELAAPHLALFEAANVLRRHEMSGVLDGTAAMLAHQDLVTLPVHLWPYSLFSDRVWQLRQNMTAYDAAYVALAESLDAPVVTLDRRLSRAAGTRCPILTPPVT